MTQENFQVYTVAVKFNMTRCLEKVNDNQWQAIERMIIDKSICPVPPFNKLLKLEKTIVNRWDFDFACIGSAWFLYSGVNNHWGSLPQTVPQTLFSPHLPSPKTSTSISKFSANTHTMIDLKKIIYFFFHWIKYQYFFKI